MQNDRETKTIEATAKVSFKPMHSGRISNLFYGGFIEHLDDLVPGMWAEMLNDRGFEGVVPRVDWCYYNGEANTCDREWEKNPTWSLDTGDTFNGNCSAKITASASQPGKISQQELGVKKGMEYRFHGYFKSDNPSLKLNVSMKALLPDGTWMILGSAELPTPTTEWSKLECAFESYGTTGEAIFELEVTGDGSVWADKLSLMPADNVRGWRKDVVEAIKESKMGVIRFGGSLLEFGYKWKDTTGDRDRRIPFYSKYWGRIEPNDVGVDEFIQFCKLVNAEPLMCLSFEDGWESARDFIEYCNGDSSTEWGKQRAENGHPEPYNVRYWQVGNETGGEEYLKGCPPFFKALKETDPNCVLISSENTPEILAAVGQYMDYTCSHHYAMGDLAGTEKSIVDDHQQVLAANLGHDVKLAVTEWNITASGWGLNRGKQATLGVALTTAQYLNILHRHSDFVGLTNRSNMANSMWSGFIKTNQLGIVKHPSYHVMKLYADHFKPVPVSVAAEVEGLDFSACRSDDGRNLTIFAVNTTKEPISLQLDLGEYQKLTPVSTEVMGDTEGRCQPDIMNHWKTPERVKIISIETDGNTVTIPAFSAVAIECE